MELRFNDLYAIQSVFNFAAKALVGKSRRTPIAPILDSLLWLPLLQRINLKLASVGHKIDNRMPL